MPLAEFAYNNSIHTTTHEIPFYINYGYHPKINMLPTSNEENPTIENFVRWLKELHSIMEKHIKEVQTCYKESPNVKRKESLTFQIGDKVWLLRHNIKTFSTM